MTAFDKKINQIATRHRWNIEKQARAAVPCYIIAAPTYEDAGKIVAVLNRCKGLHHETLTPIHYESWAVKVYDAGQIAAYRERERQKAALVDAFYMALKANGGDQNAAKAAQREKAAAEGKEAAPDPHYYPTKSHLFSCLQVESSRPAPQARFKSTAEIIAYNKQLAAERKAAKEAAAKAAADVARPAPVVVEEHHELPELVHVEPLPTKPAPKKPRTTKKPAADVAELKKAERKAMHEFMAVPETDRAGQAATLEAWRKATATRKAAEKAADEAPAVTVSMEELEPVFEKWYSNFYRTHDDNDSKEYREAVKTFDQKSKNDPEFSAIVQQFMNYRCDFISSDREAAAFVMALDELNHKHNAPEMVPSVQQLDFASIAAGVLA